MVHIDKEAERIFQVASKYKEIMELLGIKETADNEDTPMRVAKALNSMTETSRENNHKKLIHQCTTFENTNKDMVVEQDNIEFSSMCSHHHLPFMGNIKITYVPNDRIIGLSKFKRIADFFAAKPQVQEDLTSEIGDFLMTLLEPQYLRVEIYDCLHTCMCARGVKSRAATRTIYTRGVLPC